MKTAKTIEAQEERKAVRGKGRIVSESRGPVSEARQRSNANLKMFQPGQSGNPGGKAKVDLAAQIARAIFENDAPAIYAAYAKMLRKGSAYAFQVLSDRAFGKLKEQHQVEVGPYRDLSEDELRSRIKQLEKELGLIPAHFDQDEGEKPN